MKHITRAMIMIDVIMIMIDVILIMIDIIMITVGVCIIHLLSRDSCFLVGRKT